MNAAKAKSPRGKSRFTAKVALTDLEKYLGLNINDICGINYTDPTLNHCAHFVGHAMGLSVAYACKLQTGGSNPGASLRVHELFAACPQVAVWTPPAGNVEVLAFATAKANVDLIKKSMKNVPKKHVGVYSGGMIYNYSNSHDEVVADTPDNFHAKLKQAYGDPDLGMWFGTLPGSTVMLASSGVRSRRQGAGSVAIDAK